MPHEITIPLNKEIKLSFEDYFADDPKTDAIKSLYQTLKLAGLEGQRAFKFKSAKVMQRNEDGQQVPIEHKFDNELKYNGKFNPDWRPTYLDAVDNEPIKFQIGDLLYEQLLQYAALAKMREKIFNDSEDAHHQKIIQELESKGTDEVTVDNNKKAAAHNKKERLALVLTCFEQIAYDIVIQSILKKIDELNLKLLDKEYDALYPEKSTEEKSGL